MKVKLKKLISILILTILFVIALGLVFTHFNYGATTTVSLGTNVEGTLNTSTGLLTIRSTSGTGTINSSTWYSFRVAHRDPSSSEVGIKTITFSNKVYAPSNMSNFFRDCSVLTTINNISNLDTTNVTNMQSMFSGCEALTSLNLSTFKTSNVTDMRYLFTGCSSLTSLNLTNFNTSKATSMINMFMGCSKLTSLNVSSFDTSNVTDMYQMFWRCSSLSTINVSNFNTSKVENFYCMFQDCTGLTSLNVSNFNTSSATDMAGMFSCCSKLTSLNLSNFNTSKVTRMDGMFWRCTKLSSLNISSFNTANVTRVDGMFQECPALTSIDLSNFNLSKATTNNDIFTGCTNLREIYTPYPTQTITLPTTYCNATNTSDTKTYTSVSSSTFGKSVKLIIGYKINYDANGGTGSNVSDVKRYNTSISIKANPFTAPTGKKFKNWNTSATGNGTSYSANATYSTNAELTLYAQWDTNAYTVTLDKQSGSGGTSSVSATYGYAMPNITKPSRTGYTFGGYYTSINGSGTQYYTASGTSARNWDKTSNTTLYAKWTPDTYTITLNNQSATSAGSSSVTATYGQSIPSITKPTKTGYTFGGYYTSTNGSGTQYITASGTSARNWDKTSNTTLYAKWTANTCSITFNNEGATSPGTASATATYGSAMPSITKPTKTGYTFGGYYTQRNGAGTQYYNAAGSSARTCDLTSSTTLYAKWTANSYSITYNTNGGTIKSGNVTSYTTGTAVTLPTNVEKTGYSFEGWFDNSSFTGSKITSIGTSESGNKTFYAKWKKTSLPTINSLVASNTNWTNQDITITGKAIDTVSGLIAFQFSTNGALTKDSSGWQTISNTKTEITKQQTITENGTYYFYIKDAEGNINKQSIEVRNIDKVVPTMTPAVTSAIGYNDFTISSKLTDTLSGLSKMKVYYKKVDDAEYQVKEEEYTPINGTSTGAIIQSEKTVVIDKLAFNTNYKVYLECYDVAGNSVQTDEMEITFEHAVASIEYQGYSSLQNAIDAVPTDGTETEIIMQSDTVEHLIIRENRNVVIDVNGFIIRGSIKEISASVGKALYNVFNIIGDGESSGVSEEPTMLVESGSKLRLKGQGKVISEDGSAVENNGIFILDPSVELISNNKKPTLDNKGDSTINGGKITNTADGPAIENHEGATLDINDGEIHSENGTAIVNDGDLTIDGGKITSNNKDKPTIDNGGNLTMNDGWVENLAGGTAIYNRETGNLDINGGTIVGEPAIDNTEGGGMNISDNADIRGSILRPDCTVTFKEDGEVVDTKTVKYGGSATAPTLTRPGYTLSWDKEFTNVTENMEVNAIWTANTDTPYKIEYYLRNKDEEVEGYDLDTARTYYKEGTTDTTATIEEHDIKEITGFTYLEGDSKNILSGLINGEGTLTLKLYYSRNSYTISYELNGGSGDSLSNSYMYGKEFVLSRNVSRDGYTFDGWYNNPSCTGDEIKKITETETGNKTFYAKWIQEVQPQVKLGDINGDGKVTLIDLSLINQAIVGKITLNDTQKKAADINKDGNVTLIDLSLINQVIVGKITL